MKKLAQIGETPEKDNTEGKIKVFVKYLSDWG